MSHGVLPLSAVLTMSEREWMSEVDARLPALLKEAAEPDCYSCLGTGRIKGFGFSGKICPCIARCDECGMPIPRAQYHDEESGPRKVDGLPACDVCFERANPLEVAP